MDFNEIQNTWKNSFRRKKPLDRGQIETLLKIRKNSNSALNKIKKSYKIELIVGSIMYIIIVFGLFWFIKSSAVYIFLLLITLLLGWGIYFAWESYKKIKETIFDTEGLKPSLIKTIADIEKFINFGKSNFIKYLIIPCACLLGMFMGLFIASQFTSDNKDIMEMILTLERRSIVKMIFVLIITSAGTIVYSQYMLKRMYRKHLNELKQCLKEFEETDQ